jgi:PilZ domain
MMPQERRLNTRKVPEHLTYIGLPFNNGGIVLDISEGGLGFHAIAPIVADGPIAFRFSVGSAKRIKAVGELTWIDKTGRTGGLRFTELPDEVRQIIRAWTGQPETSVQDVGIAESVIPAEVAGSEGVGVGLAANESTAEPQFGAAIAIICEYDLAPFVHTTDYELEMETATAPMTETDLTAAWNLSLLPLEGEGEMETLAAAVTDADRAATGYFPLIPPDLELEMEIVAASVTDADQVATEYFPLIPPDVELEAALAKEADFSPGAARSNPVLYNLEPPVYSSPSYSLSMFPLTPYSTTETNFLSISRPGAIKHPIPAIALTAVFAFFTAVGIFSYLSTTLLGQLVLAWGGEAIIGLQMPSNPQAFTIPANSVPESTKSARN